MKRIRQRPPTAAFTFTYWVLLSLLVCAGQVRADDGEFFGGGYTQPGWLTGASIQVPEPAPNPAARADPREVIEWDGLAEPLVADCPPRRGTLFQWSYGTSFGGGPNLDEPLVTDRPDFTEASSTVGRDVAQVEFGYTYTYNADDGTSVRGQSFGEPLLRYGMLADWLEFRIALFPVEKRTTAAGVSRSSSGTEDLYLGFKVGLTPQEGILPEMALIPQMTVPTGSTALTDDEVLPGLNWLYAWEINDFVSTGGSTQINRSVDGTTGRSYLELAQSWTVALTLTERLGSYTEWFVLAPHSADTDQTQHFLNGGFTYLINDDVQFDIRYGRGLNHAADDYFAGTGLSIRFK